MAKRAFTDKQRAFVAAYCTNGFNGVRAAKTAGYTGSYSVLGSVASENLKNPKIREEIDKHFRQIAMGPDEIILRLTEMARGDLSDVLDKFGSFDMKKARARGKSFLVKEQEITEKFIPVEGSDDIVIRTTKVKLYDAKSALDTLAKYYGLLSERLKLDDWRSEAIDALRKGDITPGVAVETFGEDLAKELFALAGVKVSE